MNVRTPLIFGLLVLTASCAKADTLIGDARAVTAIERMLQQLGGRETWARSRTLYLDYRVWRTDPDESLTELAWRDLREPGQRIELRSPSQPVTWVFTAASGWVRNGEDVKVLSDAGRNSALAFWPMDFYTMLYRFAVADNELRLGFVAPRRVTVSSVDGADLGWWEIDSNGALLRWGAVSDGESLEYVYGPVRRFGELSFPAWGAAVDGSWRFEYADVRLSTTPVDPALLAMPVQ